MLISTIKTLMNGYSTIFITIDQESDKNILSAGCTLYKALNIKNACFMSFGMKMTGTNSIILLDKSNYDYFLYFCDKICKEYKLGIFGFLNESPPEKYDTENLKFIQFVPNIVEEDIYSCFLCYIE